MADVLEQLPARSGHFLLESGYHTDYWIELDALFVDPHAVGPLISEMARRIARHNPTAICGPLMGGAFLAQALASVLGVGFLYTERVEPGEGGLFNALYRLPDGLRDHARNARVALVDDVISAGSSVRATAEVLRQSNATIVTVGTLLLMGTIARDFFALAGIPIESLGERDATMWPPEECPLCEAGVALGTSR